MRRMSVFLTLLLSCGAAFADEEQRLIKRINDNVSHDYVTCAAYFAIISGALNASGEKESSDNYESIAKKAVSFAVIAAEEGRESEVAQKVTLSRLKLEMQGMKKEIYGDYSNMSILMSKHSEPCTEAMNNPEVVYNKWLTKLTSE